MNKQKQLKKNEDAEESKEDQETDEKETQDEDVDADEKSEDSADEEEVGDGEDESDSEDKETSQKTDIEKLDDVTNRLEKLDKTAKKEKLSLGKSVTKIAGALNKMVGSIETLSERVGKLENQPAATKSKSVLAYKSSTEKGEQKGESKSPRAESINKRLTELNDLFEKLGANEFAKQGFSAEAGKLKAELERVVA